ncbi:MAG TPA: NAD(+)/NADH kinase [bacterium]|nr:NAD(+)/NADH kinase [bacterium]
MSVATVTAVGLNVNVEKIHANPGVASLAREAVGLLAERGVSVWINHESAGILGYPHLGVSENELIKRVSVVVVFGGDGTILRTARAAAPQAIPILGVNLGAFGFLAEVNGPDVETALRRLLAGDYQLDERMMLQARVERSAPTAQEFIALNDIVLTKSGYARLVKLDTHVNGEHLATHLADGLIVATPTGSTAYSLSAGGPIVHPAVDGIVLTPICAHTLNSRAVLVSGGDTIAIRVEPVGTAPPPPILTVDGQEGFPLRIGDEVRVARSPHRTRLVRLGRGGFYSILRAKLTWGER